VAAPEETSEVLSETEQTSPSTPGTVPVPFNEPRTLLSATGEAFRSPPTVQGACPPSPMPAQTTGVSCAPSENAPCAPYEGPSSSATISHSSTFVLVPAGATTRVATLPGPASTPLALVQADAVELRNWQGLTQVEIAQARNDIKSLEDFIKDKDEESYQQSVAARKWSRAFAVLGIVLGFFVDRSAGAAGGLLAQYIGNRGDDRAAAWRKFKQVLDSELSRRKNKLHNLLGVSADIAKAIEKNDRRIEQLSAPTRAQLPRGRKNTRGRGRKTKRG